MRDREQQRRWQRESYARNKVNSKWMAHRRKMNRLWSKTPAGKALSQRHAKRRHQAWEIMRELKRADSFLLKFNERIEKDARNGKLRGFYERLQKRNPKQFGRLLRETIKD